MELEGFTFSFFHLALSVDKSFELNPLHIVLITSAIRTVFQGLNFYLPTFCKKRDLSSSMIDIFNNLISDVNHLGLQNYSSVLAMKNG